MALKIFKLKKLYREKNNYIIIRATIASRIVFATNTLSFIINKNYVLKQYLDM